MNLTGEQKEVHFLDAYARVHRGEACWLDRWRAATYGCGPEGTDRRFEGGVLQGPQIKRRGTLTREEAKAREKARKR